jgi:hypothetical protein
MTLEGSLEAFSLPDIFQLLSFTKKTGALRLERPGGAGVVYFTTGAVTGASSDVARQALARRLVGAGLVDDDALAAAVAAARTGGVGLSAALKQAGAVEEGVLHDHAVEQATDAVFDLLRWTAGEFAFVADEVNPDDLGVSLPVEEIITEGRSRLERWESLTATVPSPDSVVTTVLTPASGDVALSAEEWQLLALVDGRRTAAELVRLVGRGEFRTVSTLAGLVQRGVVVVRRPGEDATEGVAALLRRQSTLSELEGAPEPVGAPAPSAARPEPVPAEPVHAAPVPGPAGSDEVDDQAAPADVPVVETEIPAVVPTRPEPLRPRSPDYPEPGRTPARTSGATALAEPARIEHDPAVNKSLLLRLIAGVRGL